MGKLVCVANRKGGVGKTTLTIGIAEALVSEFKKTVLIVDLDPQGSATEALLEPEHCADLWRNNAVLSGFIEQHLQGHQPSPHEYICPMRHSLKERGSVTLDLYPNGPELWDVEWRSLAARQEERLKSAYRALLGDLKDRYAITLIDCPPGRTLGLEVAIEMADLVLCPIVPQHLAVWGMDRMREYLSELEGRQSVPLWRFVVNMRNDATRVGRDQLQQIHQRFSDEILKEGTLLGEDRMLSVQLRATIPRRLAMFRDDPDRIQTLDGFYGSETANELRKITKRMLRELGSNG
jgi:cellulose biosynthesis protein BcsQ